MLLWATIVEVGGGVGSSQASVQGRRRKWRDVIGLLSLFYKKLIGLLSLFNQCIEWHSLVRCLLKPDLFMTSVGSSGFYVMISDPCFLIFQLYLVLFTAFVHKIPVTWLQIYQDLELLQNTVFIIKMIQTILQESSYFTNININTT